MPSPEALKSFIRLQQGQAFDASLKLVKEYPRLPEELHKRFPSLAKHEENVKKWHQELILALKGGPG